MTLINDGLNFDGTAPGHFTYSFSRRIKFVRKPNPNSLILTLRRFIKNNEDFEDQILLDRFIPNRKQKININYTDIEVERDLLGSAQKYRLHYNQGRLAAYIDPIFRYVSNLSSIDEDEDYWSD